MKKIPYYDSDGNPVDLPADVDETIQADAIEALLQYARIPYIFSLLGVLSSTVVFITGLFIGEPAFIGIGLGFLLVKSFCAYTWFSIGRRTSWIYIAALIQSWLFVIFVPIGTIIFFPALRKLYAARDSFCHEQS